MWELVINDFGNETKKMRVMGGYLYLHIQKVINPIGQPPSNTVVSTSMCFVPDKS